MKKLLCALLALIMLFSALSLTSCSEEEGVPDGMTLVRGGDDIGYYFYGPEEWVVANLGNISCTYASSVDTSSMTFAETELPTEALDDYFIKEIAKLPFDSIEVTVNGTDCTFGNTTNAKKYVYTYKYNKNSYSDEVISYTCMQIFITRGESFYIFTYTANNTEYADGKSYYEYYLEKVTATVDAFVFTDKTASTGAKPEYPLTEDGFMLVSDKKLTGFDMYVPESYKVDYASAFISVSKSGVNITMSEMTYAASNQEDYWEKRTTDLKRIADKVADDNGESATSFKVISSHVPTESGNADQAAAYEYTYTLGGTNYHTYQLLVRKGNLGGKLYVFTYTATEDSYASNLEEAITIFGRIEY